MSARAGRARVGCRARRRRPRSCAGLRRRAPARRVDEHVREQNRVPKPLERVATPLGVGERRLEDADGRLQIAQLRVGATERVRDRERSLRMRLGGFLEERDGSARVADRVRDLAEPGERARRSVRSSGSRAAVNSRSASIVSPRPSATSASSNGSCAEPGRPDASSSASAPRRLASRRRSWSDGMRSPFSSRET